MRHKLKGQHGKGIGKGSDGRIFIYMKWVFNWYDFEGTESELVEKELTTSLQDRDSVFHAGQSHLQSCR